MAAVLAACLALVLLAPLAGAQAAPQIAFDLESGRILYQKDALKPWHPASITKLMTAYVTFRAIREGRIGLGSAVRISKNARSEPPSKMGFKVGTELTLDNALKMMIVKSANDIAVAIAETVSGSEAAFVAEMNAVSARLGMVNTRWTNPNGLPDDRQVTTVRDIGLLVRAIRLEFPEYSGLFRISAIRHGKRVLRSYNRLLDRYRGANGMKTGFICASGFNLAATATRNGRTVVAIVFGARSGLERVFIAKKLLDRGFNSTGLFASRRGPTIDSLSQRVDLDSAPDLRPIICGKNRQRPGIAELIGEPKKPKFNIASAFSADRDGDRDLVRIYSSGDRDRGKKTGKKKEDPYTLLVGPLLRNPVPVRVFTGGVDARAPKGGTPPAYLALEPGVRTSLPGTVPLPKMRPGLPGAAPEARIAATAPAPLLPEMQGLALPKPKPQR